MTVQLHLGFAKLYWRMVNIIKISKIIRSDVDNGISAIFHDDETNALAVKTVSQIDAIHNENLDSIAILILNQLVSSMHGNNKVNGFIAGIPTDFLFGISENTDIDPIPFSEIMDRCAVKHGFEKELISFNGFLKNIEKQIGPIRSFSELCKLEDLSNISKNILDKIN